MNFEEWWAGTEGVPYWRNVEKRQARDVWFAAIESAAKICDAKRAEWAEDAHPHDTSSAACGDCAYAIRALISPAPS